MCGRWQTLTRPHSRSTRLIALMNIYYWNIHQDSKIDKMSPTTQVYPEQLLGKIAKKAFATLGCSADEFFEVSTGWEQFHPVKISQFWSFHSAMLFSSGKKYKDNWLSGDGILLRRILCTLRLWRCPGSLGQVQSIRERKQHWQSLDDFSHWRHSENWEISSMDWTICTSTSSSPIPGDPPTHPPCPQYEIK